MGHTNSTVNYNLPQFVGTDKPSWLGDVNGAFLAIDTAIAAAKTEADSAAGGVASLQITVGGHTTQIGTLTDTVTAQGGTLNTVTALIGNGEPTTTDKTIIGAINEIASIVEAGSVSVTADGVKTKSQLLDALHALVDLNKVDIHSKLKMEAVGSYVAYLMLKNKATNGNLTFSSIFNASSALSICETAVVKTSSSTYTGIDINTNGTISGTDASSTVETAGVVYSIVY